MAIGDARVPATPDGIRPGQLGVVMLGRVTSGDVAATLVDLSVRRLLRVAEQEGDADDWLLTPLHATAPRHRRDSLLDYERTSLEALCDDGTAVTLSWVAPRLRRPLAETRAALIHDAVRRGWLRRLHHDQRTEAGEELARRIRTFQRGLRQHVGERSDDAVTGPLLPYALHFGMVHRDHLPLVRFARDWVNTCASLPGWHLSDRPTPNPLDAPVPIDNDSGAYKRWTL